MSYAVLQVKEIFGPTHPETQWVYTDSRPNRRIGGLPYRRQRFDNPTKEILVASEKGPYASVDWRRVDPQTGRVNFVPLLLLDLPTAAHACTIAQFGNHRLALILDRVD